MVKIAAGTPIDAQALSQLIVQGMTEKKGQDIAVLDLREIKNAVADFFIICSGTSDTQMDALIDSVEEEVYKQSGQTPWHREGRMSKEWVLLDFGDCVVHVFKANRRHYYGLEQLWGDADITYYDEHGNSAEAPIPPGGIVTKPNVYIN